MLAYQGRVTAVTVEEALQLVFTKHPGSYIKLAIKQVMGTWYEYTITLEGDGDNVKRRSVDRALSI